ncbi:CheB methylesterase [Candidatus Moduliflexus flocculans]|uniref:protein-glutamate methylesterase n=1 Tax=Candidatus Moduliflexus flocculans TaxID=1499966 RepID=A0A0S6VSG0_9BACT|nr:CheB methylesterase [Candidatus Moduliflexus flocculans]
MKKSIKKHYEAVVIGVSTGGLDALQRLFSSLTADFRMAVLVVPHQHPHSSNFLVTHLNARCRIPVQEALDKAPIHAGVVYIAPPNYHLLVEMDHTLSLASTEKVNYARPSIDELFFTAADAYRSRLIGVILTGANSDGSRGLQKINAVGGLTIVQDPSTAEVASMPQAALNAAQVDYVLPIEQIGTLLTRINSGEEVFYIETSASDALVE